MFYVAWNGSWKTCGHWHRRIEAAYACADTMARLDGVNPTSVPVVRIDRDGLLATIEGNPIYVQGDRVKMDRKNPMRPIHAIEWGRRVRRRSYYADGKDPRDTGDQ